MQWKYFCVLVLLYFCTKILAGEFIKNQKLFLLFQRQVQDQCITRFCVSCIRGTLLFHLTWQKWQKENTVSTWQKKPKGHEALWTLHLGRNSACYHETDSHDLNTPHKLHPLVLTPCNLKFQYTDLEGNINSRHHKQHLHITSDFSCFLSVGLESSKLFTYPRSSNIPYTLENNHSQQTLLWHMHTRTHTQLPSSKKISVPVHD